MECFGAKRRSIPSDSRGSLDLLLLYGTYQKPRYRDNKKGKILEKRSFSANSTAGHLGTCGERALLRARPAAPAAGRGRKRAMTNDPKMGQAVECSPRRRRGEAESPVYVLPPRRPLWPPWRGEECYFYPARLQVHFWTRSRAALLSGAEVGHEAPRSEWTQEAG